MIARGRRLRVGVRRRMGGQGPGSCVDVGGFEERVGSVMSVF